MEFRTQIEWNQGTNHSIETLTDHLNAFYVNKREALQIFYPEVTDAMVEKIDFALKCGDSPERSTFIFHKGTENSTEISGKCSRNSICDLNSDWELLKEKIRESNIGFKTNRTKIILNGDTLRKKSLWSYVTRREILGFLFSATAVPSIVDGIIEWSISWGLIIPSGVGFLFWLIISYIGFIQEGDYVFK